jgi:hypothetical protein
MITFLLGGMWHGAGWTFIFWGFLHGAALVIHRIYKNMGYTMNSILAWFITFNFINISWVFFRAKEWDDAIKVLRGMFGFDGVMLPEKYASKITFLQNIGIEFGQVYHDIAGKSKTTTFIILAFIVVLSFKNSMQRRETFKTNYINLAITIVFLAMSISMFSQVSEFLYFNF